MLNSKRQVCDVELFKSFSNNVFRDILICFPNAHVTTTVRKTLAHTWELVEMNNNYGLGAYSKEGLESRNKLLRKIRLSLSKNKYGFILQLPQSKNSKMMEGVIDRSLQNYPPRFNPFLEAM